jgi:hypothetical protein
VSTNPEGPFSPGPPYSSYQSYGDPGELQSQLDPLSPADPATSDRDPTAEQQASDPYTGGQSVDPYLGGQSVDPYTGGQSIDPTVGGQSVDPYVGGQSVAGPDGPTSSALSDQVSSARDQTDPFSTAAGPVVSAGVTLPSGNYSFAESVAESLRAEAREAARADLVESVESGYYSPQSLYTAERLTPDQLVEGPRPETYVEEGLESPYDVSHIESLSSSPQVGAEPSNVVVTDGADHFYGQHAGDTANNPAEYGNPNWETDAGADEMFGEGSNLRIASEAEDLGFTFGEGAEAATGAAEGLEGAGLVAGELSGAEAVAVTVEAAEGFEAADLLIILIFL